MDDQPGLSDQYRRSSPWPVFVAFGLAAAEVGIVMATYPVAVGGLLLFVGSVAGILTEAGYVDTPWPLLAGLSAVLVVLGAVLFQIGGGTVSMVGGFDVGTDGRTAVRGVAVVVAGVLAFGGAAVGYSTADRNVDPT
jgi:hypothetical protein